MKDTWFTEDETWTDDQGCFHINREYAGNVWTWVKFANNRCYIRGSAKGVQAAVDWKDVIKDYAGKKGAPPYNSYQITYSMWNNQGWNDHRFWGAATVNNALHEFYDYAAQDGINSPPSLLDVYVGRNTGFGFAFMPHFLGPDLTSIAIINGITSNSPFLLHFSDLANLYSIVTIVNQFFPDVYIGIDYTRSDRLKSLAYHEFAHASHFTNVGASYWAELVAAEVDAGGHGNENSNDVGRIAVCESWAEYLGGHVYTDRRYGSSNSTFPDWLTVLESTWNESENHIPVGLYHDLVDTGPEPLSCNQINPAQCTFVLDAVSGFSNSQFFSCLNSAATSVGAFQNCLLTNHLGSTGNTQGQVNGLFESY